MKYVYAVDDDAGFRDSLRWLLESAGYETRAYASAEQFLREYRCGTGVCLILDVRLPGMSGPDLQRLLRQRGDRLPVIFISGHVGVSAAAEAVRNGALHFLEKPFPDAALLRVIDTVPLASRNRQMTRSSRAAAPDHNPYN
jgi:two-component system, LuxR family, response regulator FixJ